MGNLKVIVLGPDIGAGCRISVSSSEGTKRRFFNSLAAKSTLASSLVSTIREAKNGKPNLPRLF